MGTPGDCSDGGVFGIFLINDAIGSSVACITSLESAQALEIAVPIEVRTVLAYAAVAIAFVIAGVLVAPRYRKTTSVVLYCVGGYLAWWRAEGLVHPSSMMLTSLATVMFARNIA
jgi:hypothetical protein